MGAFRNASPSPTKQIVIKRKINHKILLKVQVAVRAVIIVMTKDAADALTD